MTTTTERTRKAGAGIPPRPVVVAAWAIHRGLYRLLGRRRALRPATEKTWGMMRLKTIFSDRLKAREWRRQEIELRLRCAALNKMTRLGMPQSYAV